MTWLCRLTLILLLSTLTAAILSLTGAPFWAQGVAALGCGVVGGWLLAKAEKRGE